MRFVLRLAALVGLGTAALPALAQKSVATDTIYYDATAERLPTRVGAVRGIVTKPSPTGGMVQHIFNTDGRQLEQIPYSDQLGKVREGVALSWYPTGEAKARRVYHHGQLDGQAQVYYPDGTLRSIEVYEKGNNKTRMCFSPTGETMTCPTGNDGARVYARYRRGTLLLEEEVGRAVRAVPLPTGSSGERVIVACLVGVDGQIHQTHVYKSVGPEYDREALRVVSNLRASWAPELEDKEPVESFYMVHVDFLPRR